MNLARTLLGTMLASFLVWAAIIMAVFYAHSATRAWLWVIGSAVPLGIISWLLMPGAGA